LTVIRYTTDVMNSVLPICGYNYNVAVLSVNVVTCRRASHPNLHACGDYWLDVLCGVVTKTQAQAYGMWVLGGCSPLSRYILYFSCIWQ